MIGKFLDRSSKITIVLVVVLTVFFVARYVIPAIPVISQGFKQDMNTAAENLTNFEYLANLDDQQPGQTQGKTYPYTRAALQSQIDKFHRDLHHPIIEPIATFLNSPVFGY